MARLKRQPGCSVRDCCGSCEVVCEGSTTINPTGVDIILLDLPDDLHLAFDTAAGGTVNVILKISGLPTLEGTYTLEGCPEAPEFILTGNLDTKDLTHEIYYADSFDCPDPSPLFTPSIVAITITAIYFWQAGSGSTTSVGASIDYLVEYDPGFGSNEFLDFSISWNANSSITGIDCVSDDLPRTYAASLGNPPVSELTTCPGISPPLDDNSSYEWLF